MEKLSRAPEAISEYRSVLDLDGSRTDMRRALARLLEHQGLIGDAIDQYYSIVAVNPDLLEVRLSLAGCLEKKGQIYESIREYAEVLRMDGGNLVAGDKISALQRAKHWVDEQVNRYMDAIVEQMGNTDPYFRLGAELYWKVQFEAALIEFRQSQSATPRVPETHFATGACIVRKGAFDVAVSEFLEAVWLKPPRRRPTSARAPAWSGRAACSSPCPSSGKQLS
jgi:tetratricopeptide (TPR) repeat protein